MSYTARVKIVFHVAYITMELPNYPTTRLESLWNPKFQQIWRHASTISYMRGNNRPSKSTKKLSRIGHHFIVNNQLIYLKNILRKNGTFSHEKSVIGNSIIVTRNKTMNSDIGSLLITLEKQTNNPEKTKCSTGS